MMIKQRLFGLWRSLLILAFLTSGPTLPAHESNPDFYSASQFQMRVLERQQLEQQPVLLIELIPRQPIQENSGFSRILGWYDPHLKIYRKAQLWDRQGDPLVTVEFLDIRQSAYRYLAHCLRITEHYRDDAISKIELEPVELPRPSGDLFSEQNAIYI